MDGWDNGRVPAIVMARGPTALGILRSLRMADIPAYVAAPAGDMVTYSRWYRPTPGAEPWDGRPGPQAYAALDAMPLEKAVIVPGADDAALWAAELAESLLGHRFMVSTATRGVQALLQDKSAFAAYLAKTDIPHPRTYRLSSLADVERIPFGELDRVFVKPVNSQRFSDVIGVKGLWVTRRDELHDTWLRLHAQGFDVMAQEYVPGPATEHYFIDGFRDTHGDYAGVFARRRVRMSPPDFGNSSCCTSVPLSDVPAAMHHLRHLLDGLHYRGIFSAEFKRDPRDGEFRILEVNTRAWTYVEFAARHGVNVCEMAWQDALGLPVTRALRHYPEGKRCVDIYHDLASVRALRKRRALGWPEVLKQWSGASLHTFRMDDARPALHFVGDLVKRHLRESVRPPEGGGDVLQGSPLGRDPK